MVVTNHPRLGGFKQQEFIFSWFWRPEVTNQGVTRGRAASEGSGEDPSCFFQLLGAPNLLWLVATSLQSLLPSSPLFCVLSPSDNDTCHWI